MKKKVTLTTRNMIKVIKKILLIQIQQIKVGLGFLEVQTVKVSQEVAVAKVGTLAT